MGPPPTRPRLCPPAPIPPPSPDRSRPGLPRAPPLSRPPSDPWGQAADTFASTADHGPAIPLSPNGAPTLHGRQALIRAARWFRRYRDSGERRLNEDATAESFAQRALAAPRTERARRTPVLPEFTAHRERADDLILLIDDSLSMLLQQPLVKEFTELLAPLGVFRRIRTCYFDSDKTHADDIALRAAGKPAPDPHQLCEGNGREILLVLTDGVGDGWHTGAVESWLALWGRSAVVGVGQVLDRSLWPRTGTRPRRVALSVPEPPGEALTPNTRYRVRPHTLGLADPGGIPPQNAVAVPLIPMEAHELGRWARFVSRRQHRPEYPTTALLAEWRQGFPTEGNELPWDLPEPFAGGGHDTRVSPAAGDRVARFRAGTSPTAFRLAVCLAAIPLNMSTIRMVQERFVPRSRPSDLTEVLCSGLVRRREDALAPTREDRVSFDFHPGVREQLLAVGGRRQETKDLLETVADRYRDSIPWFGDVERLLLGEAPDLPLPEVDDATAPFARAIHAALLAIPGQVRAVAAQWEVPSEEPSRPQPGTAFPTPAPGAEDDPGSTARASSENPKDSTMAPADSPATGSSRRTIAEEPPVTAFDGGDAPAPAPHRREPTRTAPRGPRVRPAVWGQVPPRNVSFVGREAQLRALHEHLQQGSTALLPQTAPQTLQGMGGVGKTQLAVEFAWRHRSDYDLVWWVPADTPAQIQQALIELAPKLGLDSGGDPASTVRAVLETLRAGDPYDEWLLIYDNAGDPATVRPFIPPAGPGQVLVTSRSSQWRTTSESLLQIDTFDREESTELLLKRGPESLTESEADHIADKLGDLPLAVEQTAVWLYETLMPPSEWLALFDEKAHELLSNVSPSPDYPWSVAATMDMTLDRLHQTNRGALRLLQVCAFLAPQPIPRRLFNGARSIEAPPELAEILADPAIKLSRALRTIDRYALVKMDHRNETFQLHRLVQETLKLPLSSEERRELRHCAHMLLANLDPGDPFATRDWPRYVELLPHVWANEQWDCHNEWARQLVISEMHFLALWGGYSEGESLGVRAISAWKERMGPEHPQTLRAQMQYTQILRNLGSFREAFDRSTQLVDTLTRINGSDDEETLEAHMNLAWDLRNIGRFQDAVAVSTEVYERYQRVLGRDDILTLNAAHVHSVGLRLIGRFTEAMEIDWYNYERRIGILGPEHGLTQGSKYGHALGLMESGRYWESMSALEEQHEDDDRLSPPHSPSRLITMLALSAVKRRTGRLREALELSEEAYRLFRERLGPDNHQTVRAAASHAVSLRAAGEHEAALDLSREARERYRNLYGSDHPLYADASVNHAVTLRLLGHVEQARSVDEESMVVHTDRLGSDHPNTVANAVNLASDLIASGDAAAALEMDIQTHERARRNFGENHPLTLAVLRNTLLDRRAVEREPLDEERDDVVMRYRAVFGPDHPSTHSAEQDVRANCDLFMSGM